MRKIIILLIAFLLIGTISASPVGHWNLVFIKDGDKIELQENELKTKICLIENEPKEEILPVYIKKELKGDWIFVENLKLEKEKSLKYCFSNDNSFEYIKIGDMEVEWLDDKEIVVENNLKKNGFSITLLLEDKQSNNLQWKTEDNIFYPIVTDEQYVKSVDAGSLTFSELLPLKNVTFKLNFDEKRECVQYNQFFTECKDIRVDFSDFERKNNILSKKIEYGYPSLWECLWKENIIFVSEIRDCLSSPKEKLYIFSGEIKNLDPAFIEEYTVNSLGFFNRTETSQHGIRILTPKVILDCNKNYSEIPISDDIYNRPVVINGNNISWIPSGSYDGSGYCNFSRAGLRERINIPNSPDLVRCKNFEYDKPLSYGAWVRIYNNTNKQYISIGKTDTYPSTYEYVLILDNYWGSGGVTCSLNNRYSAEQYEKIIHSNSSIFSDGKWHHYLCTYDGRGGLRASEEGMKLFIDGKKVSTTSSDSAGYYTMYSVNDPFGIGHHGYGGNASFSFDDLVLFDFELKEEEVEFLFKNNASISKYGNLLKPSYRTGIFYNNTPTWWGINLSIADSYGSIAENGLISFFDFNGDFRDRYGRNNGSCGSCPKNATGISSNAMYFNKNTVNVGQVMQDIPSFAVSGWMLNVGNESETGNNQTIISKSNGTLRTFLIYYSFNSERIFAETNLSSCFVSSPSGFVKINTWNHFVFNFNFSSQVCELWINGNNISRDTSFSMTSGGNEIIRIGSLNETSRYFNGSIDEIGIWNRSLSREEILEIYKAGLSGKNKNNITIRSRLGNNYNISDTALISFWGFNEENNTFFKDEKGIRNGTSSGSAAPKSNNSNGLIGGGLYLDGNDVVAISELVLANGTNWTISFWVKPDYQSNWNLFFGNSSNIAVGYYRPFPSAFRIITDNNSVDISPIPFLETVGNWQHFAIRHDNRNNYTLWINGEMRGSGIANGNMIIDSIGRAYNSLYGLRGNLDEFRIYNRSLSAEEIKNLANIENYHIIWENWSSEKMIIDGNKTIETEGRFLQVQVNLNSNVSSTSPYMLRHQITSEPNLDINPPYISYEYPTKNSGEYEGISEIEVNVSVSDEYGWSNVTIFLYNDTSIISSDISYSSPFYKKYFSLSFGIYYFNATACDIRNNCNSTSTRNINLTQDSTKPTINYQYFTSENNSIVCSNIKINVSGDDLNWGNMSVNIFNTSSLIYSEITTQKNLYLEYNPVYSGIYYFNATACDIRNNCNSTSTRKVIKDAISPTVSILSPLHSYLYGFGNILLELQINDAFGIIDKTWYNLNGTNITFNNPSTITIFNTASYTLKTWANDTCGNAGYAETFFYVAGNGSTETMKKCDSENWGIYNKNLPLLKNKNCII